MEASRCQYRNAGKDCWKESSSIRLKRDGLAALVRIGPKHRLRGQQPRPHRRPDIGFRVSCHGRLCSVAETDDGSMSEADCKVSTQHQ
jgi:hypothetical protein